MKKKIERPSLLFRIFPKHSIVPVLLVISLQAVTYYIPRLINSNRTHYVIKTAVDELIPFAPVFVVFYVLAFLQWGIYYLILAREESGVMKRYLTAGLIGKLICMVIFIIVPTTISRPEPGTGIFNFCCRVVYGLDEPDNLFPSMHCLESWFCMRLALEEKKRGRVPELARSMARGYTGEMILCKNRKQVKSLEGYITRVKREEIEVFFEKIFSRRRWRFEELLDTAADEVADATEDMGMIFVKTHTIRTCLLSALVFLSTLFIKQHYFADMISAILIAEFSLFIGKLIVKKKEGKTEKSPETPEMKNKQKGSDKMKTVLKIIGKLLLGILTLVAVFVLYVVVKANASFTNLEKVDEEGAFYTLEYTGNYETPLVSKTLNIFGGGCSAFITENDNGDTITCRNYDFPHKDEEGNPSGLNVLVKCSPKGKYSSVGIADIGLFSVVGLPYYAGAFDEGISKIPLMFAPYLCMDGMNEKGLTASILALDLKDGETAMHQTAEGKETLMINAVLRQILDNCASLEEAVRLVENVNVTCTFGCDYHIFVTDAEGNSAVFEWRYNDFTVTYTDAVTNFYVGYDDGCDCYKGDKLKDIFVTPDRTWKEYRYGYGHGYGRFKTVAETLCDHVIGGEKTIMTNEEAKLLLSAVSQEYDPEESTSFTQYSVIYNNTNRTVTLWVMRDYENCYTYTVD